MELVIKSRDELNALIRSLQATVSAGDLSVLFGVSVNAQEKAEVSAAKELLSRCNELRIANFD